MSRSGKAVRTDERFSTGNRVALLRDGPEVFPAMLEAIDAAVERVYLEMYWFASDAVGTRFKEALVRANARGVDVRVMFDAVGSLGLGPEFFLPLRAGHDVRVYNPLAPWREKLSRLSRRDHRKLLVADEVAFTGGINLAEQWAPNDPLVSPWRDDSIRLQGPAVGELTACFAGVWRRLDDDYPGSRALLTSTPEPDALGSQVAVLPQSYFRQRRTAYNAYYARVRGARHRVWIANAYFLPNARMKRALRHATLRGVDVRLLVPGRSDVEIVRHASRAVWGPLLSAGARIFEFQTSILHSKTAVIDGEWSTVGSFNLDYRSYASNLELNVSVLDLDFAAEVERSFERDFERSKEVSRDHFRFRSLSDRTLETVAYWFRSWL